MVLGTVQVFCLQSPEAGTMVMLLWKHGSHLPNGPQEVEQEGTESELSPGGLGYPPGGDPITHWPLGKYEEVKHSDLV